MARQQEDPRGTAPRDGTRTDVSAEAGNVNPDLAELRDDLRDLSNSLQEVKLILRDLLYEKRHKIPGIE